MGGAERNARKKRQAQLTTKQAPAPAARRAPADRRKIVIGAVVVVVLAAAVAGGVIYTNSQKNATEGQDIAAVESAQDATVGGQGYPVERDGAVVVVGEPTAKVTLDVYEDFLCPACRSFEDSYGKDIEKHIHEGDLRVRYHLLPMLNDRSDPPGYSLDSANAALCAADADLFPEYHLSLFGAQPEEGARGWDNAQLTKLGKDLGVGSDTFASCVDEGTHEAAVQEHFDQVRGTEYLQQDFDGTKAFGTPTIAVGEKLVEPTDENWLTELLAAG